MRAVAIRCEEFRTSIERNSEGELHSIRLALSIMGSGVKKAKFLRARVVETCIQLSAENGTNASQTQGASCRR
jgi:hypothetical protein